MSRVEERIFSNRLMRTSEEVRAFDEAVQEAGALATVDLRALLRAFDDACTQQEVMYGLLHLVEGFPDDAYVAALLDESEHLRQVAPTWFRRMLVGLVNHPEACKSLERQLRVRTPPEARSALEEIASSAGPAAPRAHALIAPRGS